MSRTPNANAARPATTPPASRTRRPAASPGATAGAAPTRAKITGESAAPSATQVRTRTRRDNQKGMRSRKGGLPPGDMTLKLDIVPNLQIVRPKWKESSLIFRPLPAWNPDKFTEEGILEQDSYRVSPGQDAFTDWVRSYVACSYLGKGDDSVTFIMSDPASETGEQDQRNNPYQILYRAVWDAAQKTFTHAHWTPFVKGLNKIMSAPCRMFFMNAIVFKRGPKLYAGNGIVPMGMGKDHPPQIIQLKNSAGEEIQKLLNALNPRWEGDMNDYENSMLHGDPVAFEHGRFITVYNPEHELSNNAQLNNLDDYSVDESDGVRGGSGGGDEKGDFSSYEVRIDKRLVLNGNETRVGAAFDQPERLARVKKQIIWFDDIIRIMSPEEQALVITKALKSHRDMIEFGWSDHPEYLTADARKVLSNATQVSVPGQAPAGTESAGLEGAYDDLTPYEAPAEGEDPEAGFDSYDEEAPPEEYVENPDGEVDVEAEGEDDYVEPEVDEVVDDDPEITSADDYVDDQDELAQDAAAEELDEYEETDPEATGEVEGEDGVVADNELDPASLEPGDEPLPQEDAVQLEAMKAAMKRSENRDKATTVAASKTAKPAVAAKPATATKAATAKPAAAAAAAPAQNGRRPNAGAAKAPAAGTPKAGRRPPAK